MLKSIIMLGRDGAIAEGNVLLLPRPTGHVDFTVPGQDRMVYGTVLPNRREDFLAGLQVPAVYDDELVEIALS